MKYKTPQQGACMLLETLIKQNNKKLHKLRVWKLLKISKDQNHLKQHFYKNTSVNKFVNFSSKLHEKKILRTLSPWPEVLKTLNFIVDP